MINNLNEKRRNWLMILLWAYSVLVVGITVVASAISIFFPSTTSSTPTSMGDSIVASVLFAPVLVFVLIIGKNNLSIKEDKEDR